MITYNNKSKGKFVNYNNSTLCVRVYNNNELYLVNYFRSDNHRNFFL